MSFRLSSLVQQVHLKLILLCHFRLVFFIISDKRALYDQLGCIITLNEVDGGLKFFEYKLSIEHTICLQSIDEECLQETKCHSGKAKVVWHMFNISCTA